MKQGSITTSWDDGAPQDFVVADLLKKHGIPGTFYVPRQNKERRVITESEIRELASGFEIGGHTIHHVRLDGVSDLVADTEIRGSRDWLADVTGQDIRSFCYPGGRYTTASLETVRKAGYTFARTVQLLKTDHGKHLRSPTTLQVFPHAGSTYVKNALKRGDLNTAAFALGLRRTSLSLPDLTTYFLDQVEAKGGVFHLWGHSWEIEEKGLWRQCEDLLRMISERRSLRLCENRMLAPIH